MVKVVLIICAIAGGIAATFSIVHFSCKFVSWLSEKRRPKKIKAPTTDSNTGSPRLFLVSLPRNNQIQHSQPWVDEISRVLEEQGSVVVSQQAAISGDGGIGKTAMALEYAYRFADKYPGGVFWLEADQGPAEAVRKIADKVSAREEGFEVPEKVGEEQLVQLFLSFLESREKSLVILDNIEQPELFDRLVFNNSHVLKTTRCRDISPPPIQMNMPDDEQAREIFLAYANLNKEELTEQGQEAVKKICARLHNLPLALEIVGSSARGGNLANTLREIEKGVIGKKGHVGSKGRVSVTSALSLALMKYDHPQAIEALPYLGYLPPEEITAELLTLVMGINKENAIQILSSLNRFSVVRPKEKGGFTIHRLVQAAVRGMDEKGEIGRKVTGVLTRKVKTAYESSKFREADSVFPLLTCLAGVSKSEKWFDDVESLYSWALEISRKVDKEQPVNTRFIGQLAGVAQAQERYKEAENLYRQALMAEEKEAKKSRPYYSTLLNNLASVIRRQGQYQEAEVLLRRVLELDEKTIGKGYPYYATHLNNLGSVVQAQGRYEEAEMLFLKALKNIKSNMGADHPNFTGGLINLANVLKKQGKYQEVDKLYQGMLKGLLARLDENQPIVRTIKKDLEEIHNKLKILPKT